MKFIIALINLLVMFSCSANYTQGNKSGTKDMMFRIAEIEVNPGYLQEYLNAAMEVGKQSVVKEKGVICIFPMQEKRNENQIRILEIYADKKAYNQHIASAHFQKYKQGTLHMIKSLELVDTDPLAPEMLDHLFKKFK